jgi:hypothetical protein
VETIVIKTQAALDKLPDAFDEYTVIEIRTSARIVVNKAWGNSSVEAWGNSSVVARGNSSVVARGNSSVVAWGNSSVVAHDFAMIAVLAATVILKKLLDWSIASLRGFSLQIEVRSETATVVQTPADIERKPEDFFDRCKSDGNGSVFLFKSVNPKTGCDFQTGKIKYEGTVECPDWNPDPEIECGGGLHLSPTKGDALSYHFGKVLKCRVKKEDIVVYPKNLTKVRCRKVEVLKEGRP